MSRIKFNNRDAPWWLVLEESFILPSFNVKSMYETDENIFGSRFVGRQMESIEFSLPLIIRNNNIKSSDEIREVLADYFYSEQEAPLEFTFSNKVVMCTVEGPFELKPTVRGFAIITLTVKTSQWYYERVGLPNSDEFNTNGTLTTFNSGIETPPVQHFNISENTTQLSVTNETTEQTVSFGAERLPEEEQPQEDERILNAYAENIFYWSNVQTGSHLPVVGTAQGRYNYADGVLWPASYGDRIGKTNWIGPAKQIQLDSPVEDDWEIECRVITPPWGRRDQVRKQFMLLDVNRQPLALIEVRNQSSTNRRTTVIMSLYDGLNRRQIMYHDVSRYRRGLVLKMTKRGRRYECYYGEDFRVNTNERFNPHVNVARRVWTDRAGDFERPAIFAHTQDLRDPNSPETFVNTSYFKVMQFADNTGRTPFIFHAGDEVMIDHDRNLLTVNGSPRFYKQLRSDYFNLAKGENRITVTPSEVIESGYQTFKERYL